MSNATIDIQDGDGDTGLHHASRRGHLNIVQELVKSNATIDIKNISGNTALYVARQFGNTDIVQVLKKAEEDASVTRPLQVFAAKDSATIVVTCADMIGDELAQFTLDAESDCRALLEVIREHIP